MNILLHLQICIFYCVNQDQSEYFNLGVHMNYNSTSTTTLIIAEMGLLSIVKASTQLGLCGGAVYATHQLGVWGNTNQGEQVEIICCRFNL